MIAGAISLLLGMQAATAPAGAGRDPLVAHLESLEAAGRITAQTASLDALKKGVAEAETQILAGSPESAIPILYAFVESPRYNDWRETAEYENAEFLLGRALARSGAHLTSRQYFRALLARGSSGPYFDPTCRAVVDDALSIEDERTGLALLPAQVATTTTCRDERAYLEGKLHHKEGRLTAAEQSLASVTKRSRFYAAATYLRGLLRVRTGQYKDAKRLFCGVAGATKSATLSEGTEDQLSFVIDGRYYGLKDLLRLGLGRLSHEQGEYDLAYFHYLQIPEESAYLHRALYEAAWSMFQKEEYVASRALVEAYLKRFSSRSVGKDAAQTASGGQEKAPMLTGTDEPEARLLLAQLDLRTCSFDRARLALEDIERTYTPVMLDLEQVMGDSGRQAALVARLVDGRMHSEQEERIVELLALDPRFDELRELMLTLDREVDQAPSTRQAWLRLAGPPQAEAGKSGRKPLSTMSADALSLWEEIEALRPQVRNQSKLAEELEAVAERLSASTSRQEGSAPFLREASSVERLTSEAGNARGRLLAAASTFSSQALDALLERLRRLLMEVRLLHVDVVMANKKKLEREISNLAQGKLPPQVSKAAGADVLLEDDEEYWPYEGEHWADEVENFK